MPCSTLWGADMDMVRPHEAKTGIAPRHGFYPWHNEKCLMTLYDDRLTERAFWCATHGQWAYETPTFASVTFEDGTVKQVSPSKVRVS